MEKRDVNAIKKKLSDELVCNLRDYSESVKILVESGYSIEEIFGYITDYRTKSGADLVNCNQIIKEKKKTLNR